MKILKSRIFLQFLFELLPKVQRFCKFWMIILKTDWMQISFKKRRSSFYSKEVNKNRLFSSEKMRNSGICIYDCAHSFFGEDFLSNALYWYSSISVLIDYEGAKRPKILLAVIYRSTRRHSNSSITFYTKLKKKTEIPFYGHFRYILII